MTQTLYDLIRQDLNEQPDGILESIAEARKASMQAVLQCLSHEMAWRVDGARFEEIWNSLTTWGDIIFIVHNRNGFFEFEGRIVPGEFGHGYFNVHGDSPIGGHFKVERCKEIYFVDRPYFGTRSCTIRFVDEDGDVMFTISVGYTKEHSPKADQVAQFEALRSKYKPMA